MSDLRGEGTLYEALQSYKKQGITPMHMPGHKRWADFAADLPWHLDITEIEGFDNLHAPAGLLRDAQDRAARFWGSDAAFFLVNGSTSGILAGIYAAVQPGEKILVARNCHKAVYHAIELLGLLPIYLDPPMLEGTGVCGSISPEQVFAAVEEHPDIRLVVIVSPTYEGVLSDVGTIAQALHERGIPLLVDEAHGAHLGLSEHFPAGAVSVGADIVVQSLHKTLPSLTQTAILHLNGDLVSRERMQHALAVFQSSSPSYVLLASIDSCVTELAVRGDALLADWRMRLDGFYQTVELRKLSLFAKGRDAVHIFAHDLSKIVILCEGTNRSGMELMDALRRDFDIELEMALDGYAIAMTGLGSTDEDFDRLRGALRVLDEDCEMKRWTRKTRPYPRMPEAVMMAGAALRMPGRQVALAESVGCIARTYLWAYPPGIPLLVPGVPITQEIVASLMELTEQGVELKRTFQTLAGFVEVVDKG